MQIVKNPRPKNILLFRWCNDECLGLGRVSGRCSSDKTECKCSGDVDDDNLLVIN
jgi:hypothetical protein